MCKICKQLITSPAIWSSVDIVPMLLPGWGHLAPSLRRISVLFIGPGQQSGPLPGKEIATKPFVYSAHAASSSGQGAMTRLPALQMSPIWPHLAKASAIGRGKHILACPLAVLQIFLLNTSSFSITFHSPSCHNSRQFLSLMYATHTIYN
jgi:hypothetical protein